MRVPVQADERRAACFQKERHQRSNEHSRRNHHDMTEKYSLEDYLQNKPAPEPAPTPEEKLEWLAGSGPAKTYPGPIEEHDREWLKRLQNEPGYLILMRLLQNIVLRYENSAKLLSQTDPLGNKDALAAAWAYAGVAKLIKAELEREVATEIAKI
jgi:hypothetical protein